MHQAPQVPKIAELSWSGTPTAATFTYSMSVDQQTSAFATVSSGTDITLSRGHYYAIAYIDFTRTASTTNNEIYWHLDGSPIGMRGGSDHYQNESNDNPEATFSLDSSATLTLRQTAWSGSAIALTSHCKAFVWKVDR